MTVIDPIAIGRERGWRIDDAATFREHTQIDADVAILGSGIGGVLAAARLSAAGAKVVLLEEGGLYSSRDFRPDERRAHADLYQDNAARQTTDKGINLLQGRCVGGGSVVGWTQMQRAPLLTLEWWRSRLGLSDMLSAALEPWFIQAEQLLNVGDWMQPPNATNNLLAAGCRKLGYAWAPTRRNVNGCQDLGYCGLGCPINAKQSALSLLPMAMDAGCRLITRCRVERLVPDEAGKGIAMAGGQALDAAGRPTGHTVTVRARQYLLAAGTVGSPAIMLRSKLTDPLKLTGARLFLHPASLSLARYPQAVEPWRGAPQSVYSDHFLGKQPLDGAFGYGLSVVPLHPLLAAVLLPGFGDEYARRMRALPHLQLLQAPLRDGFSDASRGGRLRLREDGTPELDYPLTDAVWEGVRRAWLSMAEVQFAAGAAEVLTLHESAKPVTSWSAAQQMIDSLPVVSGQARLLSTQLVGGMAMGKDEQNGVVSSIGQHFQWPNLTVVDASVLPTGLGAPSQLTVLALACRAVAALQER